MEINNRKSLHILLADDDSDDREFFQEALSEAIKDSDLTMVNDGDKLMFHLKDDKNILPDIIFLDINMPCKNGRECLKEIRSNARLKNIPVIMFTTSSHPKDVDETFNNGANLYMIKPTYFSDEVKILKNIFSDDWKERLQHPEKNNFVINKNNF